MDIIAAVYIPGSKAGERIGLVRFYEAGYYRTTYDDSTWTVEEAQAFVRDFNARRDIPVEVERSAADASMFGWHTPAAKAAIDYFKQQSATQGTATAAELPNDRFSKEG